MGIAVVPPPRILALRFASVQDDHSGGFPPFGSFSAGSVIGQVNQGDLFATYNIGDVYTSGKHVEPASTVPSFVQDPAFDGALEGVLFNDGNKEQSGSAIWWDGKTVHTGSDLPAALKPTRK